LRRRDRADARGMRSGRGQPSAGGRAGHGRTHVVGSREGESVMSETWRQYLREMEDAIVTGQAAAAVRAWHRAHAAVIDQPGWQPIVRVAAAAQRVGPTPGLARPAEAPATCAWF